MANLRFEAKFKCRWQHRQCSETKFGLSCRVTWGSAAMAFGAFLRYAWIPRMRWQMRLLLARPRWSHPPLRTPLYNVLALLLRGLFWRGNTGHLSEVVQELTNFRPDTYWYAKRDRHGDTRTRSIKARLGTNVVATANGKVHNPETVCYSCLSRSRTSFSSSVAWGHCNCRF